MGETDFHLDTIGTVMLFWSWACCISVNSSSQKAGQVFLGARLMWSQLNNLVFILIDFHNIKKNNF